MNVFMGKRDKFESTLVKAKANWRRVCDSPNSTANDRLRGRVAWKNAQIARDKARALWRQARAERRRENSDRRKASAKGTWSNERRDRRKSSRRP
jgi:hypothetical protein